MATPEFLIQNFNVNTSAYGQQQIRINTKDGAGNPIDVSSGFSVSQIVMQPAIDYIKSSAIQVDITAYCTPTFDTTGFNLMLDLNSIFPALPTYHNLMNIVLTNDMVTQQICAVLQVYFNDYNGSF